MKQARDENKESTGAFFQFLFNTFFFSKFELPNSRSGSSANAAYLPLFAVFLVALLTMA